MRAKMAKVQYCSDTQVRWECVEKRQTNYGMLIVQVAAPQEFKAYLVKHLQYKIKSLLLRVIVLYRVVVLRFYYLVQHISLPVGWFLPFLNWLKCCLSRLR